MEPQQPQPPEQPVLQPEPTVIPQPQTPSAPSVAVETLPQQPAPQPEPVAVVPPVQPPVFTPTPEPLAAVPLAKKGLGRGARWGIIGGLIALVLIAAAVLAFVFLGPPSKADYQQAYDKAKSMTDAYNGLDTSSLSNATTTAEVAQKFSALKAQYDKDNAELSGMKALKDNDVKKAFESYIQKFNATMPVAEASMSIQVSCSNISTSLSDVSKAKTKTEAENTFDTAMKECMSTLKDASTSSNSDVASYGSSLYEYLTAVRTYYSEAIDAYAANDYAAYSKLKLPTAPSNDTLNLSSDKYDFPKAFEDFTTVLSKKIAA